MRLVRLLVLGVALGAACSDKSARDSQPAQHTERPSEERHLIADSPRASVTVPATREAVAKAVPAWRGNVPIAPGATEPTAVCETLARLWRNIAYTTVAVRDTTAEPMEYDNGQIQSLPSTSACIMIARADSGIDKGRDAPFWPAPDWLELPNLVADGPDGSTRTYQRDMLRCMVESNWDGEDDSDSTYVPLKWYEQRTTCWRHNRAIVPADTPLTLKRVLGRHAQISKVRHRARLEPERNAASRRRTRFHVVHDQRRLSLAVNEESRARAVDFDPDLRPRVRLEIDVRLVA